MKIICHFQKIRCGQSSNLNHLLMSKYTTKNWIFTVTNKVFTTLPAYHTKSYYHSTFCQTLHRTYTHVRVNTVQCYGRNTDTAMCPHGHTWSQITFWNNVQGTDHLACAMYHRLRKVRHCSDLCLSFFRWSFVVPSRSEISVCKLIVSINGCYKMLWCTWDFRCLATFLNWNGDCSKEACLRNEIFVLRC
jgi:hypothetical protein